MDLKGVWPIAGGTLVGAFLIGGAVARDGSLFGPTVAAWVQAVGSIIAIVAAAAIAIHVDQRAAERLRRERLKEIFDLTEAAADVIAEIINTFDAAREAVLDEKRIGHERFATAQKIVDRFPHERLTDARVRRALWEAENALVFFEPRYETYVKQVDRESMVAKDAMAKMEGCSTAARTAMASLVSRLGEMRTVMAS